MKTKLLAWLLMVTLLIPFNLSYLTPSFAVGPVALYVDATEGNDSNDGSTPSTPFFTLQAAIDKTLVDYAGVPVVIYLAEGAYPVSTMIHHSSLTIEAYQSTAGLYDEVILYPDYETVIAKPFQLPSTHWIFAAVSPVPALGLTLSHLSMTADDPTTPDVESGASLTAVYVYDADGAGSHLTIEGCTIDQVNFGVYQSYSDGLSVNIFNSTLEALRPVSMDYGPLLNIDHSTLKQSAENDDGSVLYLSSVGTVNISNSMIQGSGHDDTGFYGYFSNGTISNNEFRDLRTAIDLEDLINLTLTNNYVETSYCGFDLETKYNTKSNWTLTGNTLLKTTIPASQWEVGIDLYLDDGTGGSTFDVYDNEIINFVHGLYFDGDYYAPEDQVILNLSEEGLGNRFRGNINHLFIDDLRSPSKLDVRGTDWGTEDAAEVMSRIYFEDAIPSLTDDTEAVTLDDLFLFDDVFTTTALEEAYVDDNYTPSDSGFGETKFNSINTAKARLRSGGTVYVADGLYEEQLLLHQPLTLMGEGEKTLLKNVASEPYNSKPAILIAAKDTTISGIHFQEGSTGILVGDFDYCLSQLNSNDSYYSSFSFSYFDSAADNATIKDNYFSNATHTGISLGTSYTTHRLESLTIQNNTFQSEETLTSIALHGGYYDLVVSDPVITGNTIAGGYQSGFYLNFDGQADIRHNDFTFSGSFPYPYEAKSGMILRTREGHAVVSDNNVVYTEGVNHAETMDDCVAIRLDYNNDPTGPITYDAFQNTFTNADYGVFVYAYDLNVNDAMTTVTIGGSNANANDFSGCTIGMVSQLKPAIVNASYNFWGVSDEMIPDKIFDVNDQTYYGVVDYLPSAKVVETPPKLTGLAVRDLTLSPAFHPDTLVYNATAANAQDTVMLTASTSDGALWVNGEEVTTDGAIEIALAVGENDIVIEAVKDALTTAYSLTITREAAPVDPVDPDEPVKRDRDNDDEPAVPLVKTTTIGSSTQNQLTVTPKINDGIASVLITTSMTEALLDKAANTEGTDAPDVLSVAVTSRAASEASTLEVSLFQSNLKKIVEQTDASLQITAPWITMTFDAKALDTIHEAGDGGEITFAASTIDPDQLSAADQARVEGRPVYDLTVKNGDAFVSEFGGGYATVRIPYDLRDGENPESILVFVLMDDGSLEAVRGYYDAANGTVVFKTSHFSKFVISHNPVMFRDVASGAWYHDAVTFIAAREITSGVADGLFGPQDSLTRGQFVVMLLKAYGIRSEETTKAGRSTQIVNFADAGSTYYTNALYTAKKLGIAKGIGSNLFAPDREISREEMLVLLYNALQIMNEMPTANDGSVGLALEGFADAQLVSDWAIPGVSELIRTKIVAGADNKIMPQDMTTRAEMAQVLYQLLGR